MFRRLYAAAFVPLFLPRGVEYQAGRGCPCRWRAPGDETSPAIFTSLCREWEAEKSPGNREIRRFASHSLYPTMALSPPFASLITPESVRLRSREIHPDARLISLGT